MTKVPLKKITKVGMRELARDLKLLEEYDYVDIEDKKFYDCGMEIVSVDAFLEKVS